MNLTVMNVKQKKTRSGNPSLVMVRMSRTEALKTIASLTAQLIVNNPNVDRYEMESEIDGTYFSIGVDNGKS